jgi:hypothetical protein
MTKKDEMYITPQEALDLESKATKTSLLRPGAQRYESLDPTVEGTWRFLTSHGENVALVWTDWQKGFDLITIKSGPISDRLGNYVITARALDIPAAWAYTTLDTFISRFEKKDEVTLSDQSNGLLKGAISATGGDEEPEGELENVTESRV